MTTTKKYATMTATAAIVVTAKTKKEAALKLQVNIKDVYVYNVMQLTEGREFNHKTTMEARNLNTPQNYLRSRKTLLLVRCCYVSVFFFIFCAVAIK